MEDWDPMEEDYKSVSFNSYNRGPGRNMPLDHHPRFKNEKSSVSPSTTVYVIGIPLDVNEQGLTNIFKRYGQVVRCYVGKAKEGNNRTYGFVDYSKLSEAEEAISALDNKPPFHMHVTFARSKTEKKRKEEAENTEYVNFKKELKKESLLRIPQRPTRQHEEGSETHSDGPKLGSQRNVQVHINTADNRKVVSCMNNNIEEENSKPSEKCLVERFTAYGPSNVRSASRASSVAGIEINNTEYGVLEREILASSDDYQSSFFNQKLVQFPCTLCKSLGGFRCSECKAWYCGQYCQMNDWPQHKMVCLPLSSDKESVTGQEMQTTKKSQSNFYSDRETGQLQNGSYCKRQQSDACSGFSRNPDSSSDTLNPQRNLKSVNNDSNLHPNANVFKKPTDPRNVDKPNSNPNNFNINKDSSVPVCERPSVSGQQKNINCSSEKGNVRPTRDKFSGETKELRRPLRKPGEIQTKLPTQTKPSLVADFFTSGPPTVLVCYVVSPDEFYVQNKNNEEIIANFTVELHQEASRGKALNVPLSPGEYCIALYTDGCWYRAKVLKEAQSRAHEVYFVDYGNKETVLLENIRLLPMKFRTLPEQALRCGMANVSPLCNNWRPDDIINFKSLISEVELICHFKQERNETAIVDLEDPEGSFVSKFMLDIQIAQKAKPPVTATGQEVPPPSPLLSTTAKTPLPSTSSKSPLPSTTVKSPLPSTTAKSPLPSTTSKSPLPSNLAKSSLPSNSAKSSLPSNSAKSSLPSNSAKSSLPSNSAKSSLPSTTARSPLPSTTARSPLCASTMEISPVSSSVTQTLLPSVLTSLTKCSEPFRVQVTWIVDQQNFWALVVDSEPFVKLSGVSETLAANYERNNSFKPSVGEIVGAKSADGCFYRALVKSKVSPTTYNVLFMDFGNEEEVEAVTPLPTEQGSFACPALQLSVSTSEQILVDSELLLRVTSTEANHSVFSLLDSDHKEISKVFGKPWFVGHVPTISTEKQARAETSNQPLPELAKKTRKPPLPSILSNLQVDPNPIIVVVTWIVSDQNFWAMVVDETLGPAITELSGVLTSSFEKESIGFSASPGQLVSAKSADGVCYRAFVKSKTKTGVYTVFFVDYGNEEEVTSVAPLSQDSLSYASVALHFTASENLNLALQSFLYLRVSCVETNFVTCTLIDEEGLELSELVGMPWYSGQIEEPDSGVSSPTQGPSTQEACALFSTMPRRPLNSDTVVNVAWASTPQEIYLHEINNVCTLSKLMTKVAKTVAGPKQKWAPIVDQIVLALYEDQVWYRGKILAISDGVAFVHFIDYGNEAQVSLNELQPCSLELAHVPPFAIHVMLDGMDTMTHEQAEQLVQNTWKVEVIGESQGVPCVQLIGDNGPFGVVAEVSKETEEFSNQNFSTQPYIHMPIGKKVKVVVSAVDSPDLIYVNYFPTEESLEEWDKMVEDLQSYCVTAQAPSSFHPEIGRFCLVLDGEGTENALWYRAVALSETKIGWNVLFVDYGKRKEVTGNILPVPRQFMTMPIQALQCKLYGVLDDTWSEQVCNSLRDIMVDQLFEVEMISKEEDFLIADFPLTRNYMVQKGLLKLDPAVASSVEPTNVPAHEMPSTSFSDLGSLSQEATSATSVQLIRDSTNDPKAIPANDNKGISDKSTCQQKLMLEIKRLQEQLASLNSG